LALSIAALALTRPHRVTGVGPGGTPVARGETPTPPGITVDSSAQTVQALEPLTTITTTLLPREAIAWSPDGDTLASASSDMERSQAAITLWDPSTGKKRGEKAAEAGLSGIA